MTPPNQTQFVQASPIVLIAAALLVLWFLGQASAIAAPIFLAIVIAITLSPVADRIGRLGVGRAVGVTAVMLGLVGVLVVVVMLVASSVTEMSDQVDGLKANIDENLTNLTQKLAAMGIDLPQGEGGALADGDTLGSVIELIANTLAGFAGDVFLVLLVTLFLLIEAPWFMRRCSEVESETGRSFESLRLLLIDIRRYIGLKTLTSLAHAILITIWLVVLGVPFVVVWALLSFLLYFIPNIGIAVPATGAAIMAFAEHGLLTGILVGVGFGVTSTLMNNVVEPKFFGERLGMSMSVIFISLIVWGWLMGPIGMLIAIPLTMMIKRLMEASERTRWLAKLVE
jgi:predicted PurR-regulated permease PerM